MTPSRSPLTETEFSALETMLGDLLASAQDEHEEAAILYIHARLTAIFEHDTAARTARERLLARRSETHSMAKAATIVRSSNISLP